jgi:hypothetical protein
MRDSRQAYKQVSGNGAATVLNSTVSADLGQKNANASQNKKSCKATHKPTQIAAHFILPQRTTTVTIVLKLLKI